MALDTLVAQIAYRARLLERALHDAGPWSIRFEAGRLIFDVPAELEFTDEGVTFRAHFPGLRDEDGLAVVCLRGEPQTYHLCRASLTPFTIEWTIKARLDDFEPRH